MSTTKMSKIRPVLKAKKRWKPSLHQKYWFIEPDGGIDWTYWVAGEVDKAFYDFGNCFFTRKSATEVAKKIKMLLKKGVLLVYVLEGSGTPEYPYIQVGYIVAKDGSVLGRLDGDWIYTEDLFEKFRLRK